MFFYSRFLPKEIFSKLDETKPKVPIFLDTKTESKAEMEKSWEEATP
jgi:hypothetical protein